MTLWVEASQGKSPYRRVWSPYNYLKVFVSAWARASQVSHHHARFGDHRHCGFGETDTILVVKV